MSQDDLILCGAILKTEITALNFLSWAFSILANSKRKHFRLLHLLITRNVITDWEVPIFGCKQIPEKDMATNYYSSQQKKYKVNILASLEYTC